jgi:Patatin-like phospholipase
MNGRRICAKATIEICTNLAGVFITCSNLLSNEGTFALLYVEKRDLACLVASGSSFASDCATNSALRGSLLKQASQLRYQTVVDRTTGKLAGRLRVALPCDGAEMKGSRVIRELENAESAMTTKIDSVKLDRDALGQVVLVLQGGGALGAYQVGVYQALSEAGIEPDWVIGTSIGAINASLIAGNSPEQRLPRLEEFWNRVTYTPAQLAALFEPQAANKMTVAAGLTGFFEPNPLAFLGLEVPLGSDLAGYYSTKPLEHMLEALIDPAHLNSGRPRLQTGQALFR